MNSIITAICLILIFASFAQAQGAAAPVATSTAAEPKKEKRFSAEWRFRLSGTSYQDDVSQSKVVDIRTDVKAKYNLSPLLQLDIQPSLRMQSGQSQSLAGAYSPENKISLVQAAAHYEPYNEFKFSGGALNQKYMHTSMLVDPIAFPAARLEGNFVAGNFKTSLDAESAIPTSSSLSTNTKELESTPSLNSAAIKLGWEGAKNFYVRTSVGYFIYDSLPSAVAQSSKKLGNDIKTISEKEFSFIYEYAGFESMTEIKFPIYDLFDLSIGGDYLQNQKAPSELNSGFSAFVRSEIHVTSNMDMTLGGNYFEIQPEAAVAYFNASGFKTNRIGYSADTSFVFKKEGFSVGATYVESQLMYTEAEKLKEKTLLLRLSTLFVSL